MKFLNNIKIGVRLNVILSLAMAAIIVALGIYVINNQKKKVLADTDLRMTEQVNDLALLIRNEIDQNQERVNTSIEFAEHYFNSSGELRIVSEEKVSVTATNQFTQSVRNIEVDAWYVDDK